MAKKKEEAKAPEGAPAWMATYSDLVTLLMCFFVLLFAFSNIDAKKFEAVMNSFQGGSGPLNGGTSITEDDNNMDGKPDINDTEPSETSYRAVMIRVKESEDGKKDPRGEADEEGTGKSLHAVATNGISNDPSDYEWQSSNPKAVEVDENGNITIKDPSQSAVIFAKDKETNVVGFINVNSEIENSDVPDILNSSEWAKEELDEALRQGLIPESLKNLDMRAEINRKEFAAVALGVYEALAGDRVPPAEENPFIDTEDVSVLKAHSVGITCGVSFDTFEPYSPLDREQAATMLTRAYKKAHFKDWSLEEDSSPKFKLDYSNVTLFKDDKDISDWAKPSVYFMVKNGIIEGVGGNIFAPKAYTSEANAMAFANMTREQAIVMGLRMVQNLGDN